MVKTLIFGILVWKLCGGIVLLVVLGLIVYALVRAARRRRMSRGPRV